MSMKIEHDRNGDYSIKLSGMRKRFTATTLEQLILAIKHYFGQYSEHHSAYKVKNCPLCEE